MLQDFVRGSTQEAECVCVCGSFGQAGHSEEREKTNEQKKSSKTGAAGGSKPIQKRNCLFKDFPLQQIFLFEIANDDRTCVVCQARFNWQAYFSSKEEKTAILYPEVKSEVFN